jgi:signal transduction histidine kinase
MGPVTADRLFAWAGPLARPSGPLPRPSRPGWAFDIVLAFAVATIGLDYLTALGNRIPFDEHPARLLGLVALTLMSGVALVFRRRYPLVVFWIVLGALVLTPDLASRLTFYPFVIAAYSAAAFSPYRAPALVSLLLGVLETGELRYDVWPVVPNQYVTLFIVVPMLVATLGLRAWRVRADAERERLSEVERRQADRLRGAVEDERARIARELHDVVTHNVSVMVIQAGAARKVMGRSPDQATEALLAVEESGRLALTELRQAMGLLTTDSGGPDLAPQPGLDQLPALVGRVRDAGADVELTVTGPARPVPSGIGLAAYRVVQEGLTNAVKHAAGAGARVVVEYRPDGLRVEVTDTGGAAAPAAATGHGRGLPGLRERLAVYGGTLQAGRRPAGGFRVTALIPLEAA